MLSERTAATAAVTAAKSSQPAMPRTTRIETSDGVFLAADVFESDQAPPPTAVIVLNGATGVRRGFYARFAAHAAERNLAVVTYDYRGMGGSLHTGITRFQGRMLDWGERDFPAVIRWCQNTFPSVPVFAIGHSVGGQLFGLAPESGELQGLVGIGAQSGFWKLWPTRARMWLYWHLLVPGFTRAFGHLPGWLGTGASLPKGVALEWARWCRAREFFVDTDGSPLKTYFAEISAPVLWVEIEDDPYAPAAAVAWLAGQFTNAPLERRRFSGAHFGTGPIGHFKLFTPAYSQAWEQILQWIEHRSAVLEAG